MWKCISNLTVDPLTVDCWSSPPESTVNSVDHWLPHCWLLTLSLLTVDCQSPHCWPSTLSLLTVDHLTVDHWPSHCWLLIINCLTVDHQPSHCWLLIVDCLTVDHWPSHCWLLIVNCLTVDCWPSHCWLLILPPRINSQQCWSSITSLLTTGALCPEQWDLCASQTFCVKHRLATIIFKIQKFEEV